MYKKFFKSKTIWSGIILLGIGICQFYGVNLPYEILYAADGFFGLYGVRDAIDAKKVV